MTATLTPDPILGNAAAHMRGLALIAQCAADDLRAAGIPATSLDAAVKAYTDSATAIESEARRG